MIFISGETTGDYKEKFKKEEKMLKSKGYRVVNMANVRGMYDTWEEYMKASITNMLICDEVYMLNGWEKSKGATIEVKLAMELGYKITQEVENDK